jgi:hypothetical protein
VGGSNLFCKGFRLFRSIFMYDANTEYSRAVFCGGAAVCSAQVLEELYMHLCKYYILTRVFVWGAAVCSAHILEA